MKTKNDSTMLFDTIISYAPEDLPNIAEYRLQLPDGRVGVIAESDDEDGAVYKYAVTIHTANPVLPGVEGDWWDTVDAEVGATDDFVEAQAMLSAVA
jgi:hypothetical protein